MMPKQSIIAIITAIMISTYTECLYVHVLLCVCVRVCVCV